MHAFTNSKHISFSFWPPRSPEGQMKILYTPGISAAGYIVFALTFVRAYVRSLVRSCVRSFVTFRHVRRIYLKVFG